MRATFLFLLMCGVSMGQQNCPGGQCQPRVISQQIVAQRVIAPQARETINLSPITAADAKALADAAKERPAIVGDRLSVVQNATVRVTVSNVCGSGCVVGFDSDGRALILTNAHVAGTQRGRVVNVQRWDDTGRTETAKASIVASGYGRGNSIDFALLRAADGFANGIVPIPIADRYPDPESMITTFGAPRCEWPSLQVLRMTRNDGQVIKWKPEAIGGRSGSAVIDYADGAPRVVGLLTWGGGGEGLGQSTPFLLSVMRGKMPASLEPLPQGIKEVKELAAPQESLDLDSIIAKPIIKKPTPQTEPDVAPTPQTPPTAPAPVTVIQIPQLPFLPPWATAIITMINSGILAWHYWQNRKNKPEAK